jgi:hypothetical protein
MMQQQVSAAVVPTSLQNVRKANKIGVDVGVRILQRVPHSRLRGEVDDDWKSVSHKQLRDGGAINQIQPFEMKAWIVLKDIEPGRFQLRIIISVEVVQPDNSPA